MRNAGPCRFEFGHHVMRNGGSCRISGFKIGRNARIFGAITVEFNPNVMHARGVRRIAEPVENVMCNGAVRTDRNGTVQYSLRRRVRGNLRPFPGVSPKVARASLPRLIPVLEARGPVSAAGPHL